MKSIFFIILFIEILRTAESQNNRTRMIGGDMAKPGQFPFVVALVTQTLVSLCTGSLVTWDKILTASHCVHDSMIKTVVAGETNGNILRDKGKLTGGQARKVKKFVMHPEAVKSYKTTGETSRENDLAVIMVANKFQKTPTVCFIKLGTMLKPDSVCVGIGYGRHLKDKDLPDGKLRSGKFQIMKESFWQPKMYYVRSKNQNVNQGDSGGPLVNDKLNALVGVCYATSADYKISMYVNLFEHLPWIKKQLRGSRSQRRSNGIRSIGIRCEINRISISTLFWLFSIGIF